MWRSIGVSLMVVVLLGFPWLEYGTNGMTDGPDVMTITEDVEPFENSDPPPPLHQQARSAVRDYRSGARQ